MLSSWPPMYILARVVIATVFAFARPLVIRQVMEIVAEDLAPKVSYNDLVAKAKDDQVGMSLVQDGHR